jgi:nucleoside-diphosphate-sugar epimerase
MADGETTQLLVLGGLGMIGRHFVKYVLDYNLATAVRIVDKAVPVMAYLSPEFEKMLQRPEVEFVQANLAMPEHVKRAFAPSDKIKGRFQMVVNLAAETRYGQPEPIYNDYVTNLRIQCAQYAANCGVDKYIEVSTTQVYAGTSKDKAKESDKIAPWTQVAKAHAEAEAALPTIAGLDYCILRLPIVYGPGDVSGLMPRLTVAAVYAHTRERMELLWGESLRLHTVHVQDVAACLWHLLCAGVKGEAYNLVDKGDTSQGSLNHVLEQVFPGLKTGYYGSITSTIAQTQMDELVEDANDGHLGPWTELCKTAGIFATPLAPWLHKELLYHHHTSVDGRKLEATGFEVSCPQVTKELLLDAVRYWTELNKFPPLSLI